jgi:ribosomal-protein-alanine acetyltransferase
MPLPGPLIAPGGVAMSYPEMTVNLRRAGPADLDAVDAIERRAFDRDGFARRNLARMLKSRTAEFILAEEGGRPAGYVLVLFRKGARAARLYSIAVAPQSRGRGLSREMVRAAVACAINRGCDRLRLEVRAANTRAIRLYENSGFELLREMSGYYPDGEAAYQMEKRIGAISRAAS